MESRIENTVITKERGTQAFIAYDISNSGYVLAFQSFLFPLFIAGSDATNGVSWAWAVAGSSLVAIVLGPILGRFGDRVGRGIIFTSLVVAVGVLATMAPVLPLSLSATLIIFVLFNAGFELSQTIYDSFLRDLATDAKELTRLSTRAWGWGYVGGIVVAGLYFLLNELGVDVRYMLVCMGLLYLLMSAFPAWVFRNAGRRDRTTTFSWRELFATRPPVSWTHLIIYWIIAECVAAVLYFAALFARDEVGLGVGTIGGLMLATQFLAFPLTIMAGRIVQPRHQVLAIRVCILGWLIALSLLAVASSLLDLVLVMFIVAFIIGSTQALLRAHYAARIKKGQAGEGFGYYAVAQKSAAVFSPLFVGFVLAVTGSARFGFLGLALLVLVALYLVGFLPASNRTTVDVPDAAS